ncbi:hypothetical protein EI969_26850 [Pseudomonas sp. PB101]|nr:hypothetical protein [Pseudomonas sp. PB101]
MNPVGDSWAVLTGLSHDTRSISRSVQTKRTDLVFGSVVIPVAQHDYSQVELIDGCLQCDGNPTRVRKKGFVLSEIYVWLSPSSASSESGSSVVESSSLSAPPCP